MAESQELGVDAMLQRRALAHQNSRQRAHSRSARSSKLGSQIAGTGSRRETSVGTHASTRSVLHTTGPKALDLLRVGDLDLPTSQPSRSALIKQAKVQPLTTDIQSGVQQQHGPASALPPQ